MVLISRGMVRGNDGARVLALPAAAGSQIGDPALFGKWRMMAIELSSS
jgi:hypothetical protein